MAKERWRRRFPGVFNLHEDKQVMDDGTSLFLIQYKTRLSGVLKEPIRNAEISQEGKQAASVVS